MKKKLIQVKIDGAGVYATMDLFICTKTYHANLFFFCCTRRTMGEKKKLNGKKCQNFVEFAVKCQWNESNMKIEIYSKNELSWRQM